MKCEKCGKNEATMYYKETVNGVTREMHLCPECAQKENLGGAFENAFQSIDRKSTRLNSSHIPLSRMPSSA